jgi:hypothetical protein
LPKRNFGFEKRQKEEARKKKKDEKLQRKREAREQDQADGAASETDATVNPVPPEGTA